MSFCGEIVFISAESPYKHAETESDTRSKQERGSLFRPYPRPCHECENQGGSTCKLQPHYFRHTRIPQRHPLLLSFSLSSFSSYRHPGLLPLNIYFQNGARALFFCLSHCMCIYVSTTKLEPSANFPAFPQFYAQCRNGKYPSQMVL